MASFDLLGLDPGATVAAPASAPAVAAAAGLGVAMAVPVAPGVATLAAPTANTAATPEQTQQPPLGSDEIIAYPPATTYKRWKPKPVDESAPRINPAAVPVAAGGVYIGTLDMPPGCVMAEPCTPAVGSRSTVDGEQKRYVVRCEGRWRVRSAPSLNSKVIGTVACGTIVVAVDELGQGTAEAAASSLRSPAPVRMADGSDANPSERVVHSISSLWVKVVQFEAQETLGVSEIKRDAGSGGDIYCLRRNALGYGLYEVDLEPMEGPLVTLPEGLACELRLDAQTAAAEKNEDCSFTWKLLGAAESVSRFVSQTVSSNADEAGASNEIPAPVKRRPEEIFELKQREQFKKACSFLRKSTLKVVEKAKAGGLPADAINGGTDITVGLQKELRRRFSRLRASLLAAFRSARPMIVHKKPGEEAEAGAAAPPSASPGVAPATAPAESTNTVWPEGSVAELEQFAELLGRLERTGGGAETHLELRQEAVKFNVDHCRELDNYAWSLGKGLAAVSAPNLVVGSQPTGNTGTTNDGELLLLESSAIDIGKRTGGGYGGSGLMPLLPPPPPSSCGVGTAKLI